jgi:hypothetical protein
VRRDKALEGFILALNTAHNDVVRMNVRACVHLRACTCVRVYTCVRVCTCVRVWAPTCAMHHFNC